MCRPPAECEAGLIRGVAVVKVALIVAIMLAILALVCAACGLAMLLSGYVMVGAFQIVPGAPRASGMDRELVRWIVFFGASLGATVWLLVGYRRQKRKS